MLRNLLKINLNQPDKKSLTKLANRLSHPHEPPSSFIIIKISQAFCMYHQISSGTYKIQNRSLQKSHPLLINDLDNNFTYLMIDDNRGHIMHLYLINPKRLIPIDSLLTIIKNQPFPSYLDYFYYFSKKLERNLHLNNLNQEQ